MFTKLLSEAVKELKGEKIENTNDVLVKIAIDAYIPEEYIATSEERMVAYKRISALEDDESVMKLKRELIDVYGNIPNEVLSLMEVSLVRKLAQKLNAVEIISFGAEIDIIFDKKESITDNEFIVDSVYKLRFDCTIDFSNKPMIKFSKEKTCRENFEIVKKFLIETLKLKNKSKKN
jgi:transcription-repair coupling factor (superfamily II helicase)